MNKILFPLLLLLTVVPASAAQVDSLLTALDQAIANSHIYVRIKQNSLDELRHRLNYGQLSADERYNLYNEMYNNYQSFKYDSAFAYALKLQETARTLNNPMKIKSAKLKLSLILLSSGMYKEAFDSLETINVEGMPETLKIDYYELMARAYYDLESYDLDNYFAPNYLKQGHMYADSAITMTEKNGPRHLYISGLKYLKQRDFEKAVENFKMILSNHTITGHRYAIVASTLASVYKERGDTREATEFMIRAAIADIESSTKEAIALINLSDLIYHRGDVSRAYGYIRQALKDADFYGARQRKIQASYVLPIIEQAQMTKIESRRKSLYTYSIVVTLLSMLLIFFAVIIYLQLKQLKQAKRTEAQMNLSLHKTNNMLQEANHKLLEANAIKEEYIGHSFNLYTEYLDKICKLKNGINRKLMDRKYNEIYHVMDSIDLKKERENLYISFDKIFLKLFPNFISEFNKYFNEEDRIIPRDNGPLSVEFRIFMLIRLGIHDHEKIAKILEYSVRTVYNYKTRVKNRALLSNEKFEQKIMDIRAF